MTSPASSVREVDFTAPGAVDPSDFGLDGLTSAAARLAVDLSPTSGLGASRLSQVRRADGASLSASGRSWFHLRTAAGPGALLVDQSLAVVVADLLMGGSGEIEPRALTSVEERVLVPHLQRAMGPLSSAFTPAGIGPVEVRESGRGAMGLRGDTFAVEISVAATTELDSPDLGTITLIVPAPAPPRSAQAGEADGEGTSRGLGAFLEVKLPLGVRTGMSVVPAARLRELAVGEVLQLRHRCDVPLRVCVGPIDMATGLLGRSEDTMTVQVLALLGEEQARAIAAQALRYERPVSGVLRADSPAAISAGDPDGAPTPDSDNPDTTPDPQPARAQDTEGEAEMSANHEDSAVAAAVAAAEGALEGAGTQPAGTPGAPAAAPLALGLLADVPVEVSVEVGRTMISLRDAVTLGPGQVVTLDAAADALATVLVNGRVVARGQVVVVDDVYGVRISELVEE